MRKTKIFIKVLDRNSKESKTDYIDLEVSALVKGQWAITPAVDYNHKLSKDEFCVTHIKSGLKFPLSPLKKEAAELLMEHCLESMPKWNGKEEMPSEFFHQGKNIIRIMMDYLIDRGEA